MTTNNNSNYSDYRNYTHHTPLVFTHIEVYVAESSLKSSSESGNGMYKTQKSGRKLIFISILS